MPFSVLQHVVLIHHLHVCRKCRLHSAVFRFEHLPMRHLFVHRVEDVQTKLIVIVILEYINDAAQLGMDRSMIQLGHERTEEPGMKYLPFLLRRHIRSIPILFISADEPYTYY